MNESLKFENGKPCVPVLTEGTLPRFLESKRMEKSVSRNGHRLKIFSGTANPALSKVFISSWNFIVPFFSGNNLLQFEGFYGHKLE